MNKLSSGPQSNRCASKQKEQEKISSSSRGASKPATLSGKNEAEKPRHWRGHDRHPRTLCPARSEVCRYCRKKGHYTSVCLVCLSRHLDCVETQQEAPKAALLGAIKTSGAGVWDAAVLVQSQSLDFAIDTGAGETVLPMQVFGMLKNRPPLRQLHGPDGKLFPATGIARIELIYCNREPFKMSVLDGICTPLLGR